MTEYQVVVSFRLAAALGQDAAAQHFRDLFRALVRKGWEMADLDVAVREIGAAGESSEMEGEGP